MSHCPKIRNTIRNFLQRVLSLPLLPPLVLRQGRCEKLAVCIKSGGKPCIFDTFTGAAAVADGLVAVKRKKPSGRRFPIRVMERRSLPPVQPVPHENGMHGSGRKYWDMRQEHTRPRVATVHGLRQCWFTNAMRSGVPGCMADAILGHGDKKNEVLYLNISNQQLLEAIDMMKFDTGRRTDG